MKIRLLATLVGLAVSFVLPAFAQQKDGVDPQIIEKVNAKIKAFDEAVNNNDAAALFAEDAVFVTDGGPVYGQKAIEMVCERVPRMAP
jgi:ketosteroid isomerase-like protein